MSETTDSFSSVWTLLALAGAILGVVDHRVIGIQVFGAILLVILLGSTAVQYIKPFSFADGDGFMQGVIGLTGAGGALAGYVPAWIASWVFRRRRETKS